MDVFSGVNIRTKYVIELQENNNLVNTVVFYPDDIVSYSFDESDYTVHMLCKCGCNKPMIISFGEENKDEFLSLKYRLTK